jgi:antitoxin PrlF
MLTSKLTSKSRTTIPRQVRTALGLCAGDEIAYAIESGRVLLARNECHVPQDAIFVEWASDADTFAFGNL